MDGFDDDIFSLFTKRAYDMAGVMPKVKVYINGKDVTVNSFVKYVNLYFDPNS
jgi:DNA topoisomerase-2